MDVKYRGSCEQMHLQMHEAIRDGLDRRGIEYTAIRTTITPILLPSDSVHIAPKSKASLSYTWFNDWKYLPLLNQ